MEYAEYIEQATTEVKEQMLLEGATANEKIVGEFLIEQFKDEEMGLAKPFMENKWRLSHIWSEVTKKAKNHLHGVNGAVTSETVFGWVCGIVSGKSGSKPKAGKNDVVQEAKQMKPTAEKPKAKKPEKPKKESMQLSLFDFMEEDPK